MQPGYGNTALYLPKSGAFWLLGFFVSVILAVDAIWLTGARIRKLYKAHDVEIDRYSSFD